MSMPLSACSDKTSPKVWLWTLSVNGKYTDNGTKRKKSDRPKSGRRFLQPHTVLGASRRAPPGAGCRAEKRDNGGGPPLSRERWGELPPDCGPDRGSCCRPPPPGAGPGQIDVNIVVAQTIWEGLWMNCVVQSTGQMQCKVYDSILALPAEVQAGRALTVVVALLGLVALMVTVVGAQCTNCIQPGKMKSRIVIAGGAIYILCGVLVLIPLCWFANIVIRDFYDPTVPTSQKREMGAALYIGWAFLLAYELIARIVGGLDSETWEIFVCPGSSG
ncbi:claudin 5 [Columba livia]|uniref:Claudin 5 n=1 Tax=Columba livia TaxID=8932 RepID=A0A2I0M8I9_COLLI|nr:claudin 5 [Columba livia]